MKEDRINEIMEDITEDSNLCIIREALKQYKEEEIIDVSKIKEYQLIFKFSDVIVNIDAESKEEAKIRADDMLMSDYNPQNDSVCYDIDIEEVD